MAARVAVEEQGTRPHASAAEAGSSNLAAEDHDGIPDLHAAGEGPRSGGGARCGEVWREEEAVGWRTRWEDEPSKGKGRCIFGFPCDRDAKWIARLPLCWRRELIGRCMCVTDFRYGSSYA